MRRHTSWLVGLALMTACGPKPEAPEVAPPEPVEESVAEPEVSAPEEVAAGPDVVVEAAEPSEATAEPAAETITPEVDNTTDAAPEAAPAENAPVVEDAPVTAEDPTPAIFDRGLVLVASDRAAALARFDEVLVLDSTAVLSQYKGGLLAFSGGSGAASAYYKFDDLTISGGCQ